MHAKTPPGNLSKRALDLWEGVTSKYDLRMDELYVLESACREVDLIDSMVERQKSEDLIGKGSMGQPVAAPLVSELRQHRAALAAFLKQLKLPDEDGRGAQNTSDAARKAAISPSTRARSSWSMKELASLRGAISASLRLRCSG